MKHLLRNSICVPVIALFSVTAAYGQTKGSPQIKGDPQMKGAVKPMAPVLKSNTKLSAALETLHQQFTAKKLNLGTAKKGGGPVALDSFMVIKDGTVLVDFTVKEDAALAKAQLEKMGVKVTGVYGRVISGYVPIELLPQMESATAIRFVKPSFKPRHQNSKGINALQNIKNFSPPSIPIIPVISQGDTAMYSNIARKKYHVNGKGVKVGIISDSYNNLGTADIGVKHGELPGIGNPFGYTKPVEVIKDYSGGETDEGRAMAEIVHDVAPGANLAFYTAYDGEADFAQGIQTLADHGCNVIGDDIFYYDELFFQDGIIAQSVDAVKKRGVTYFSAAGNESVRSYESIYRPTDVELFGPGNGFAHDFSGTPGYTRLGQPLYVPSGGTLLLEFQYDQSSYSASGVGPESDMDIYLTDIFGNIVAVGGSDNIKSGEPNELLFFPNYSTDQTFFLYIVKYSGPNPKHIKYINFGDGLFYLTTPAIPGILAPTVVGHAKAEGAIATGAAFYINTPAYGVDTALVEYFSSVGGTPNYLDNEGKRITPQVRKKPNIVAPDGGNTSFFDPYGNGDIPQDADSYPNFFGTSAATPHAAGVAALMIQAEHLNNITPDQIKGVLSATASDMDNIYTDGFDKGFDFNTGYGFVNAEKAVGKVKFPHRYIDDLKLEPVCSDNPQAYRKWRITNPNPFPVEVEWFTQDGKQHGTLIVQPGCVAFETNTVKGNNCQLPNIAVIVWKDNFEFPHFDIAFSTRAKCGVDIVANENSDKTIVVVAGLAATDLAPNVAEVYPNPSKNSFKLYLSLNSTQTTNIDLLSIDGKKLQSKTVSQNKGVVEIDASNYKPGVYIMNIKQGDFSKTIKVIKE